ncbi:MAG TPA: hypothetical protein PKL57_12015 [Candidatus Wallbacteria bacterium]|nr:hypothetical protein [Candidatus Wallbacteria bacterium]
MDKINEILNWLMLAIFSCWFVADKTMPAVDQSAPEAAPAAGTAIHDTTGAMTERPEKPYDTASCEGSIITVGLSEMLKRQRVRRNLRRRKEDQAS